MKKHYLVDATIHIVSWVFGYWLAHSLMGHSSSKETYSFIVAWWMACYIGYIANVGMKATLLAFPLYATILTTSFLIGSTWFYSDPPTQVNSLFVFIVVGNAMLFVSPILVNAAVRRIRQKLKSA